MEGKSYSIREGGGLSGAVLQHPSFMSKELRPRKDEAASRGFHSWLVAEVRLEPQSFHRKAELFPQ